MLSKKRIMQLTTAVHNLGIAYYRITKTSIHSEEADKFYKNMHGGEGVDSYMVNVTKCSIHNDYLPIIEEIMHLSNAIEIAIGKLYFKEMAIKDMSESSESKED